MRIGIRGIESIAAGFRAAADAFGSEALESQDERNALLLARMSKAFSRAAMILEARDRSKRLGTDK